MKKARTKNQCLKIGAMLSLLLLFGSFCACKTKNGDISPFSDSQAQNTSVNNVIKDPMWGKCTVRVINYAIGTEFYVLSSNGKYSIYGTPAICSLFTFNNKQDIHNITEIASGSISSNELLKLNKLIPLLKTNGVMLPIKAPENNSMYRIESIEVFVSVDDLEETHFFKNYDTWEGYPPKEYDELLTIVSNLYPNSSVLCR